METTNQMTGLYIMRNFKIIFLNPVEVCHIKLVISISVQHHFFSLKIILVRFVNTSTVILYVLYIFIQNNTFRKGVDFFHNLVSPYLKYAMLDCINMAVLLHPCVETTKDLCDACPIEVHFLTAPILHCFYMIS